MGPVMGLSRRRILQLAVAATFAPFGRPALADTYPSRVVRLFVGFPPGGGADLATRIVANGLSELWRQQVIVENRPGAGARIALDTVAHAPADGYAMLLAPGSPLVQPLLFSTLTFDPAADLAPVSLIGTYPNIIVVPNSSPFQKLEELIAHAKANPGTMSWGSPGIGSVPHLAGELFKHRAGIEITHVPYRGANQGLMSDFLAGRLDLMLNTTGSLLDVSSWYAIYVPAKTPAEIIAKVNADMAAILNDTAAKERFKLLGVLPRGSTPAELAAMNVADAALWGPIIKEANIKVE